MPILYAGGRLESVRVVAGSPSDSQSSGSYDSGASDASLFVPNGAEVSCPLFDATMAATSVQAGHTLYFHMRARVGASGTNGDSRDLVIFYGTDGFPWIKWYHGGGGVVYLYQNTGSGASPNWTQISSGVNIGTSIVTLDFAIALGASGTPTVCSMYLGDNYQAAGSGSVTFATTPALASVHLLPGDSSGGYYSQLAASQDLSLVGTVVKTMRATGNGANTGWTGGYANVNEKGDNDSTADLAATAGLLQSYPQTNVAVPTNYSIVTVFNWMRAKNDGSAPANIESVARVAGQNFVSGDLSGIGVGYSAVGYRYDVNPATGLPWTQADWNAPVELGYGSAT